MNETENQEILSLDDIYFKDAFTKTEDKLNLDVDNANIKCLTSKDNKFSLDNNGNLIVNSITTNSINAQNILDMIYPIGSIYLTLNDINPSTLFGGTWEQIKDKFLLCAGDEYSAGTTGGSSELQAHSHSIPSLSGSAASNGNHTHTLGADLDVTYTTKNPGSFSMHNNSPSGAQRSFYTGNQGAHTHNVTTNASTTGNTGSGNGGNMPPYLTVYVWKRTT